MRNVLIVVLLLAAAIAFGVDSPSEARGQSCSGLSSEFRGASCGGFAAAPERAVILRAAPVRTWLANRPQRSVLVGGPRAAGCSGFSAVPRAASCAGFEAAPYAGPRASCAGN